MYNDLAMFIKLVEVKNYTKTALLLNTTQATLSRRIKNLEEELGVCLINNKSRSFEITKYGEFIYQELYLIIKQLIVNISDFKENKDVIAGTLKIALPAALSYNLFTPMLSNFKQQYPKIKLIITYTPQPVDMIKNSYDLAISTILPLSQHSKVKLLQKY